PQQLARLFMKFLDDPSPIVRRGAARFVACSVCKLTEDSDPGYHEMILKFAPEAKIEPPETKKAGAKKPAERSKVALELEKLNVRARLTELRDRDSDPSVRDTVRTALEALN